MADEVANSFAAFDEALTDFEKVLRPLLQAVEKCGVEDSGVPNITAARIHATLAYTVNALYYVYLRANNNNDDDDDNDSVHPVLEELERIQKLFVKLRTVDRKVHGTTEETTLVHGMQVSTDKLDKFLTPAEENLAHALRGNRQGRQRHKVFSSSSEEKKSQVPKKRKKSKATEDEKECKGDAGNDGDVEMTPVKKTAKKSKKAKKQDDDEENMETEGNTTSKKKRKSRKSDAEAATEGSTKKKRKSSKEMETPSTKVVAPEEETPVKKSGRKKKREKSVAN